LKQSVLTGCELNLEVCFYEPTDLGCSPHPFNYRYTKKWDTEWQAEHGGNIPSERHYENVGDIATTNDWYYNDNRIGHQRFYADTPDWIVKIAVRRCWISERGDQSRQ